MHYHFTCFCIEEVEVYTWSPLAQRGKEKDTKRGVAADPQAEATSTAAGAKTEGAAAERRGAAAMRGRAGTGAARPETTRSTGQRLGGPVQQEPLPQLCLPRCSVRFSFYEAPLHTDVISRCLTFRGSTLL